MKLRQYSARVFGWLLLLLLATSPALAERRVALVIGNDAYTHLPKLNNARKDAEGMAAKLQELGFETILKVNASERDMARALRDFEGRLSSGAVGLAYFAGHGIQADGKNYLIPANADIGHAGATTLRIYEDGRWRWCECGQVIRRRLYCIWQHPHFTPGWCNG